LLSKTLIQSLAWDGGRARQKNGIFSFHVFFVIGVKWNLENRKVIALFRASRDGR
jgi:hypothetical protein